MEVVRASPPLRYGLNDLYAARPHRSEHDPLRRVVPMAGPTPQLAPTPQSARIFAAPCRLRPCRSCQDRPSARKSLAFRAIQLLPSRGAGPRYQPRPMLEFLSFHADNEDFSITSMAVWRCRSGTSSMGRLRSAGSNRSRRKRYRRYQLQRAFVLFWNFFVGGLVVPCVRPGVGLEQRGVARKDRKRRVQAQGGGLGGFAHEPPIKRSYRPFCFPAEERA